MCTSPQNIIGSIRSRDTRRKCKNEKWKILNAIQYLKLRAMDVIRVVLETVGCEGLEWIYLAQDRFQWWALVHILG